MSNTILVVDDDPAIRGMIGHLLKREGYRVAEASNGEEALNYLWKSQELPVLIFLDLRMPVLDGWKFRDVQRSDKLLSKIPVVVVTSVKTAETDLNSIKADAFIKKPIEVHVLLRTLKNHLGDPTADKKTARRAA